VDTDGFEQLYRLHATSVRAYVRRRLPAEEIEEALAEVWLTAWRRRAVLPADPAPWLYATARRVLANQRRGRSRLAALRTRLANEPPAPPVSGVPDRTLAEALGQLNARDREALLLTAWEGLTPTDAAAALGCSLSAFNTRLHRARGRLRVELAAREGIADLPTTNLEVQPCPRT
jgi:RNA polymerase sigma-70 factor (ECF subfamily)